VPGLQGLTPHRGDLTADWVRGGNRLRDLLASIFPRPGSGLRLLHPLGAPTSRFLRL